MRSEPLPAGAIGWVSLLSPNEGLI